MDSIYMTIIFYDIISFIIILYKSLFTNNYRLIKYNALNYYQISVY